MNKKILMYLENEMSENDRAVFEAALQASPALQKEVAEVDRFLSGLQKLQQKPALDDYYAEARVRLKQKVSAQPVPFFTGNRKLLFTGSGALLIVLITVFTLFQHGKATLENELAEIAPEVALAYVQATPVEMEMINAESPIAVSEEVLDEALKQELGVTKENASEVINNLNITSDELLSSLSPEEIEDLSTKLKN